MRSVTNILAATVVLMGVGGAVVAASVADSSDPPRVGDPVIIERSPAPGDDEPPGSSGPASSGGGDSTLPIRPDDESEDDTDDRHENDPDAVGRLVWDRDQGRVRFVASGLEQLAPGQTYQLWVYANGTYSSLGTFSADESGFARHVNNLPEGLGPYESAVVTIEGAPGSFEREGPSVFVTDLSRIGE